MHSLVTEQYARTVQADRLAAAARRRPPADGSDLERLVKMAAAGDQPAWDALVDRFGPSLLRVARAQGLRRHEAEDAVQETWMRLMRHIGAVRQPRALGGWLRTTVRNESLRLRVRLERERPSEQDLRDALPDTTTRETPDESDAARCRVAVARALVSRPSVMFADEPTGNLDSTTSGEILGLLRTSVDELGQTTVMVTHDAHAAAIADRVLFLADGDIVRDLGPSTAHEILDTLESVSGR